MFDLFELLSTRYAYTALTAHLLCLQSLALSAYNDARGTEREAACRDRILAWFRTEPAAVTTKGSEGLKAALAKDAAVRHDAQLRSLLDMGMMSEEEWKAGVQSASSGVDAFDASFLCRLREMCHTRLDADVMAPFVASDEYRSMLLKSLPKPIEEKAFEEPLERHQALQLEKDVSWLVSVAGVSHMIFDFDKTLVAQHLGSGIPVSQVAIERTTPTSAHILCAALRAGIEVGIATFSDCNFCESWPCGSIVDRIGSAEDEEPNVSGEALVRQVIANSIGAFAAARIRVVAAYPDVLQERGGGVLMWCGAQNSRGQALSSS